MNIFIINSHNDCKNTQEIISNLKANISKSITISLVKNTRFWKRKALKKIKESSVILFIVGKNSHNNQNIIWELKKALNHNKPIYILKLKDSYKLPEILNTTENNANTTKVEVSIDEFISKMNCYHQDDIDLFNIFANNLSPSVLFEQYKIFVKTAEDLMVRRQNVHSFYISFISLLITAIGGLLALNIALPLKLFLEFTLCGMGLFLSISWLKILKSYGTLNTAKINVISKIEKHLPLSLFDAEWTVLSNKKNKYKSFTKTEKGIPIFFAIIFSLGIILFISSFIYLLYQFSKIYTCKKIFYLFDIYNWKDLYKFKVENINNINLNNITLSDLINFLTS